MFMKSIPEKIHLGIYGIGVRDGKVLMIQKGRGPYTGLWDLPGGKIEPGEAFEEALRREFDEETGLNVLSHEPLCVSEYQCQWEFEGEEKGFHHIALYNAVELASGAVKQEADGHDSQGAQWVTLPLVASTIAPIAHDVLRSQGLLK